MKRAKHYRHYILQIKIITEEKTFIVRIQIIAVKSGANKSDIRNRFRTSRTYRNRNA